MSTMSDLHVAFARLERDGRDTAARADVENIITNLEHTIFQATAAALRDILNAVDEPATGAINV